MTHLALIALLTVGLGACVGTAGISTWEHQSGPGFRKERFDEKRIYGNTLHGVGSEACLSIVSRQAGPSGQISDTEVTTCNPGLSVQSHGERNEPLP